jgi:hypothetical protein
MDKTDHELRSRCIQNYWLSFNKDLVIHSLFYSAFLL